MYDGRMDEGMNTQVTLIFDPAAARKLAIDMLQAAERCTEDGQAVRIHSFGTHAGAWKVETPIYG